MNETSLIMNINDEDVNLGHALCSANYRIRTRLNTTSPGAGVNAYSTIDMAFAASDPLSELVWSPHNGLSLKCAHSNLADKKPFLLWNVNGFSRSQSIRSKGSEDETVVDQGQLVLDAADIFVDYDGKNNNVMEEEAGNTDDAMQEENCMDEGEEDLGRIQNVQIAELNTSANGISDCNQNSNIDIYDGGSDIMGLDVANCSETLATKVSDAFVCSLPKNLQLQKELDDKVTSGTGEENMNKTYMPSCIHAPPLKKLESYAENDFCNLIAKEASSNSGEMELRGDISPNVGKSSTKSKICLYQEKGKEKALSDGDIYGRSLNDEDSNESCNSAGLFSKGIKRQSYDPGLILGSKRMKKQIHESPGSTSTIRHDSSFMTWISNMVKGLADCKKEDSSSLALTLACPNSNQQEIFMCNKTHDTTSLNMGFQTMFQSLYCTKTNISNAKESKASAENLPGSCDSNTDYSCKKIVVGQLSKSTADISFSPCVCERDSVENKASDILVCNTAKDGIIPSESLGIQVDMAAEKTSPDTPLAMSYVPEKSKHFTSLWITRFSSRTPELEKCNEITEETNDYCPKVNLDSRVSDVFPIEKFTSSEAMASVFARRLDALKHITPSKMTCFFCGCCHDLRECPDITETELEKLLVKMSSFDRVEESPCLCIRCFQLDHWAISCPLAAPSNGIQRSTEANLANDVKENQKFPLCNIFTTQNTIVPPDEIFHAIKNLRLSRADILRWMNSDLSFSHLNGFFVRLRLGNLENGVGEAKYYVACITGDGREDNGWRSKKCVLVDVGGVKSCVGSEYVSNHDFVENEIKAWWCRIVKSGCRIPSIYDLNSKINDRKSLGF